MSFYDEEIDDIQVETQHEKQLSNVEETWAEMKRMYEEDGARIDVIASMFGYGCQEVVLYAKRNGWKKTAKAMQKYTMDGIAAIPTSEIVTADQVKNMLINGNFKHLALGSHMIDDAIARLQGCNLGAKEITAIAKLAETGRKIFDSAQYGATEYLEIDQKSDKFKKNGDNGDSNLIPFFSGSDQL